MSEIFDFDKMKKEKQEKNEPKGQIIDMQNIGSLFDDLSKRLKELNPEAAFGSPMTEYFQTEEELTHFIMELGFKHGIILSKEEIKNEFTRENTKHCRDIWNYITFEKRERLKNEKLNVKMQEIKPLKKMFQLSDLTKEQSYVLTIVLEIISKKTHTPKEEIDLYSNIEDYIEESFPYNRQIALELYNEMIQELNIPSIFSSKHPNIIAVFPRIADFVETFCPVMGIEAPEFPRYE